MASSIVVKGADVRLFLNGEVYPEVQRFSYTINYGEQEIYGIDQAFPQEITTTTVSVSGSISGLRTKYSGGLQAKALRPLIFDILNSPYISLRLVDRSNGEDIIYIPSIKVTDETVTAVAKGIINLSFKFKGVIPFNPLDRNSGS
jgi:hypothetical protein